MSSLTSERDISELVLLPQKAQEDLEFTAKHQSSADKSGDSQQEQDKKVRAGETASCSSV